jgi:hypothetical protein
MNCPSHDPGFTVLLRACHFSSSACMVWGSCLHMSSSSHIILQLKFALGDTTLPGTSKEYKICQTEYTVQYMQN